MSHHPQSWDMTASGRPLGWSAAMLRHRWSMLALVWAALFVSFLDRLAWANVSVVAADAIGLQIAALNIFVTAFYVGYIVSNAVSGLATDLLGGRLMLTLALIPLGAFTFLFGFTQSIAVGLVLQAMMGLAAGADYSAGVKLIAAWFGRCDRGRAMGFYCTAPMVGVIVTSATVAMTIDVVGWSGIYRAFGVITLGLGVACFVFLHDHPPGAGAKASTRAAAGSLASNIRLLVGNRDLLLLTAAGFGAMWGSWGLVFWANALMIRGHHLSAATAGAIVGLFGLGGIVGNPLMGWLSDRLGGLRKWPIIICLVSFVVILLVFGGLSAEWQFRLAAPVVGIAAFVYMPLIGAMVTEVAGVALAGSATGLSNACWQLGTGLVPVVVGVVFQWTGSFQAAFMALAAGPALAATCMLFVHEDRAAD
jgi:sugar phosphate permease